MEKLEEVKKEAEALGVRCLVVPCDVTDTNQIRNAVEACVAEFGRIDILINNAAAGFATPAVETDDATWERVMNTNVNGVFYFAREVGKVMLKQNYGRIINIGSFHCQVTMNGVPRSGYSTAKGAVYMMTKALAAEWAKNGITVNTLGPGYFASGALQAGIWKYGLVLGAFGLLIPVVLFGIGTPHLPTGLSTIMASSELPCGILISVFVLGEPVSTLQAAGVVVILAGVVVSQLPNLLPAKTGVPEDPR